jgi:DnaJ-class molecular chaperone
MALLIVIVIVVVAFGSVYFRSLRTHPWVKCGACNGSGKNFHSVFTKAYGKCAKCNGTGRQDRMGTRFRP